MPIFSSNRVSGAGATIVAAEGYTEHDFGRILSECAINDMRLFNAAIARDFKEAEALSEGTMVASEIQALREFSVKEAWKGLKEKLKKLWAKIKGVFKSVYAKLSLWLNRNTKAYIAQHRKELINKNCKDCKVPKYLNPRTRSVSITDIIRDAGEHERLSVNTADLKKYLQGTAIDSLTSAVAAGNYDSAISSLAKAVAEDKMPTADELTQAAMKGRFDEPNASLTFGGTIWKGDVNALMNNLSGNAQALKDLKKCSNEIDKSFKTIINKLNKAEKAAEKESEESKSYNAASQIVSKIQTLFNAISAAAIKVIKKSISNDRGLIATLVAYNPGAKQESAMLEFAFMAGYDALHEETEDLTDEDVAAAAEEEGIEIDIEIKGEGDVDVNVDDQTGDDE